jgi:hypothetical protein
LAQKAREEEGEKEKEEEWEKEKLDGEKLREELKEKLAHDVKPEVPTETQDQVSPVIPTPASALSNPYVAVLQSFLALPCFATISSVPTWPADVSCPAVIAGHFGEGPAPADNLAALGAAAADAEASDDVNGGTGVKTERVDGATRDGSKGSTASRDVGSADSQGKSSSTGATSKGGVAKGQGTSDRGGASARPAWGGSSGGGSSGGGVGRNPNRDRDSHDGSNREGHCSRDRSHQYKTKSLDGFRPQLPRIQAYTGKGNWETYLVQFERMATRSGWDDRDKVDRLFDCLADQALEYAQRMSTEDYHELCAEMSRRFKLKDTPIASRRQLHLIKQLEGEELAEFSQRVHWLAMDGHPNARPSTVQEVAVEAFLRGCKDKYAAEMAMEKEPVTIFDAVEYVKNSSSNHQALFGSKGHVSFSEAEPLDVKVASVDSGAEQRLKKVEEQLGSRLSNVEQNVSELLSLVKERLRSTSPNSGYRSTGSSLSEVECFHCHKKGHFQRTCPDRPRSRSPSPSQGNGKGL